MVTFEKTKHSAGAIKLPESSVFLDQGTTDRWRLRRWVDRDRLKQTDVPSTMLVSGKVLPSFEAELTKGPLRTKRWMIA